MLVRDLAWSTKASGALRDGIARFCTPGATPTFTRASAHTFTNPVGDSETVDIDVEAYGADGLFILPASGGRAVARYYYTNNFGARTWNADHGSFQCEIKFLDTLAEDRTIAYVFHDANNLAKLWYDNASGKIKFALTIAGVATTITALANAVTNTFYQVGVVWTNYQLENNSTAPSISLYIDRVLQATTATGGASASLLINGGFESSTSGGFNAGWIDGSVGNQLLAAPDDGSHGTVGPRTGTWGCRLTGLLGASGTARAQQDFAAIPGAQLIVSGYGRTTSSTYNTGIAIQNLTTGNYYDGTLNAWVPTLAYLGATNTTGSWVLITKTFNLEAGAASFAIRVQLDLSLSSAGSANWDDITVTTNIPSAAMIEVASSNFDIGSTAGTNVLHGNVRKIHSYQDVLTDTEMRRPI